MSFSIDLSQFGLKQDDVSASIPFSVLEQAISYGMYKTRQANKRNTFLPASMKKPPIASFVISTSNGMLITISRGEKVNIPEVKRSKKRHKLITLVKDEDTNVRWVCK